MGYSLISVVPACKCGGRIVLFYVRAI